MWYKKSHLDYNPSEMPESVMEIATSVFDSFTLDILKDEEFPRVLDINYIYHKLMAVFNNELRSVVNWNLNHPLQLSIGNHE